MTEEYIAKRKLQLRHASGSIMQVNDALLPYRFYVKGNPFVSGKPK